MAANGTRTIQVKFDGSTTGLTAASKQAEKDISSVGSKAEKSGGLVGGAIAIGLTAAGPLVAASLIGGVALGFVGVTALVQKNNRQVQASFGDLKDQVVGEMTDVTDQVVPYLTKAAGSLQQTFANLGPQLHEAFSFAGPDIKVLTSGVDNFAENAMPGLVISMRNSRPIVQGVSTVLGDLGSTVTTVLTDVSSHADEFENDLDQIGALVQNVGDVTGAVLPGLSSGFGVTVGAANGLLTTLKPIAPVLGDIAGEALPAVGAFKLFSLATGPLKSLGDKVSGVSGNMGGLTVRMTGNAAAGEKVASATTKVGTAIGKLGNALPLVGVGYALADAGAQKLFGSTDELANNLLNQTGPALTQTEVQLAKNDATSLALKNSLGGLGGFLASTFVPTTKDVESGMTDVQKATVDYDEAVKAFGPHSAQAAQAQKTLASATDQAGLAQQRLSFATQDANVKLANQQTLLLNSVDAGLGFQSSVLSLKQAQTDYATAVKISGKNSDQAKTAFIGLQQAQDQAVRASISLADANNQNSTASQKATADTIAFARGVFSAAAASNGQASPALKQLETRLNGAQIAAFTATGKIAGTHQEIVKLPSGKTIKINVDSNGQAVANATQRAIDKVHSRTVRLTVNEDIVLGKTPSAGVQGIGGLLGLPHRALGGPAPAGQALIVGDGGGPEIFVPHQNGSIIGTRETADLLGGPDGDVIIELDGEPIARIAKAVLMRSNRDLVARVKAGSRIR